MASGVRIDSLRGFSTSAPEGVGHLAYGSPKGEPRYESAFQQTLKLSIHKSELPTFASRTRLAGGFVFWGAVAAQQLR